jgi:flagellar basal-body rod protein FlgB
MRKSEPMAVTNPDHFAPSGDGVTRASDNDPYQAEVLASGNDVSLEQEFLKSNDVMRSYSMNTQILKTFTTMLQTVTKG